MYEDAIRKSTTLYVTQQINSEIFLKAPHAMMAIKKIRKRSICSCRTAWWGSGRYTGSRQFCALSATPLLGLRCASPAEAAKHSVDYNYRTS